MDSTHPLIFQSSSPFNNLLVTVPKAPITNGIIVTFMVQFFQFPNKVQVLIRLFISLQFYSAVSRDSKVLGSASSIIFVHHNKVWPRLGDPFVSQNPRGVCVSHSTGKILGCAYNNCSYDKLKFLAQYPVDHLAHPVVGWLFGFYGISTFVGYLMPDLGMVTIFLR